MKQLESGLVAKKLSKNESTLLTQIQFDMAMPLITLEDMAITAAGDNYFTRHSTYHLNYYCNCFILGKENKPFQSLISLSCLADYLVRAYGVYTLREES